MDTTPLQDAFSALSTAETSLEKLRKGCCDPDRVPCIADLDGILDETRTMLGRVESDPHAAEVVVTALGDVGAQLGKLQVTCCTPKRIPLYARLLEDLTKVQLGVAAATGTGH